MQMQYIKKRNNTKIPDNDDNEIKQVPSAAYVGAGVHD